MHHTIRRIEAPTVDVSTVTTHVINLVLPEGIDVTDEVRVVIHGAGGSQSVSVRPTTLVPRIKDEGWGEADNRF